MPRDYQLRQGATDKPEPEGYDEITIHLAILEALADGVDPMSGEALPGESVFKSEQVLAALAAGTVALQKEHISYFYFTSDIQIDYSFPQATL